MEDDARRPAPHVIANWSAEQWVAEMRRLADRAWQSDEEHTASVETLQGLLPFRA